MKVQVNGKQISVGDSLSEYVSGRLMNGVAKYFEHSIDAHVTFSRESRMYRCDCAVHIGQGMNLQSQADAEDIHASFEKAMARIDKQLRRYKRRLAKYHSNRKAKALKESAVQSFVLAADEDGNDESDDFQPIIIAETSITIPTLTVGEAVMRLDLEEAPALLFHSSANGGLNLVYHRPDGNVGWVDAQSANQTADLRGDDN